MYSAVSYTHLDVYKRQVYGSTIPRRLCGFPAFIIHDSVKSVYGVFFEPLLTFIFRRFSLNNNMCMQGRIYGGGGSNWTEPPPKGRKSLRILLSLNFRLFYLFYYFFSWVCQLSNSSKFFKIYYKHVYYTALEEAYTCLLYTSRCV